MPKFIFEELRLCHADKQFVNGSVAATEERGVSLRANFHSGSGGALQ
jgi:hypothetical protein